MPSIGADRRNRLAYRVFDMERTLAPGELHPWEKVGVPIALVGFKADWTLDFVDRRKYMIKSGGENIYPAEIEQVLMASPKIDNAVVVRRPDAKWGEVPVAFVVARDQQLTAAEVVAMCRGRIAGYKVPKDVRFVADADLPRSTSGKVKRHELEQLLIEERAPAASS